MTEHDKLALLNMINKASEALQHVIAVEEDDDELPTIDYFKIKSFWHEIIHELIKIAESNECKVLWEGYKAVKIVEKEKK